MKADAWRVWLFAMVANGLGLIAEIAAVLVSHRPHLGALEMVVSLLIMDAAYKRKGLYLTILSIEAALSLFVLLRFFLVGSGGFGHAFVHLELARMAYWICVAGAYLSQIVLGVVLNLDRVKGSPSENST